MKKTFLQYSILRSIYTILALFALTLSNCSKSGLSISSGLSPQYIISSEEIKQTVSQEFPYERHISSVGSLLLQNPIVTMAPNQNKIQIKTDLRVFGSSDLERIPFLQTLVSQAHHGECQIACGVRYDRKTRGLYLQEPAIEYLSIPSLPPLLTRHSQSLLNTIAPQILNQHPVHTLDKSLASRFLKKIEVQQNGVALKFGL